MPDRHAVYILIGTGKAFVGNDNLEITDLVEFVTVVVSSLLGKVCLFKDIGSHLSSFCVKYLDIELNLLVGKSETVVESEGADTVGEHRRHKFAGSGRLAIERRSECVLVTDKGELRTVVGGAFFVTAEDSRVLGGPTGSIGSLQWHC